MFEGLNFFSIRLKIYFEKKKNVRVRKRGRERSSIVSTAFKSRARRVCHMTHTLLLFIGFGPLGPSPRQVNVNFGSKILRLECYTKPKFLATFRGLRRSHMFYHTHYSAHLLLTSQMNNRYATKCKKAQGARVGVGGGGGECIVTPTQSSLFPSTAFLPCFEPLRLSSGLLKIQTCEFRFV